MFGFTVTAMKADPRRLVMVFLRIVLGLIFLAAGWSKLGQTLPTLAAIYSYQIVMPDVVAETLAFVLPWIELALAVALFGGLFMPWTLAATGLVLAGFTVLTAQAWWRGLDIDCGCFDFSMLHPSLAVLATPGGATLRNLVLLGLTALLAWLWWREKAPLNPASSAAPR